MALLAIDMNRLILMALIHNVLVIKLLHYLCIIQPMQCILRLATMDVKISQHMK